MTKHGANGVRNQKAEFLLTVQRGGLRLSRMYYRLHSEVIAGTPTSERESLFLSTQTGRRIRKPPPIPIQDCRAVRLRSDRTASLSACRNRTSVSMSESAARTIMLSLALIPCSVDAYPLSCLSLVKSSG